MMREHPEHVLTPQDVIIKGGEIVTPAMLAAGVDAFESLAMAGERWNLADLVRTIYVAMANERSTIP